MKANFYPLDNEILKNSLDGAETIDFKKYPNLLNILFNHWIMRKENFTRISKEYKKGEFEISIRIIQKDLGITKYNAEKLIKKFIQNKLINPVRKGNSSTQKSIYFNCIFSDSKSDSNQTVNQSVIARDTNDSSIDNQTVKQTLSQTVNQNSKKELIKKNYKKDINNDSSESLWNSYPLKKGKARAIKKIPNLIRQYGEEQLQRGISRYIEDIEFERTNGFKGKKYQNGDTFFSGTYIDYLDENYQKQQITDKLEEIRDEYGFKIIK